MCKSEIQKVDTKRKFVYNKSVKTAGWKARMRTRYMNDRIRTPLKKKRKREKNNGIMGHL